MAILRNAAEKFRPVALVHSNRRDHRGTKEHESFGTTSGKFLLGSLEMGRLTKCVGVKLLGLREFDAQPRPRDHLQIGLVSAAHRVLVAIRCTKHVCPRVIPPQVFDQGCVH